MDICNDGHQQIVFDGRSCPMCAATEEIQVLYKRVEELEAVEDEFENHECPKVEREEP